MLSIKHTHSLAHTCIVCKHNGVSLSFRRKYAILSISATPSYDSDRYVWANLKKINRTSATQRQREGTRKERQISKFCTHWFGEEKKSRTSAFEIMFDIIPEFSVYRGNFTHQCLKKLTQPNIRTQCFGLSTWNDDDDRYNGCCDAYSERIEMNKKKERTNK